MPSAERKEQDKLRKSVITDYDKLHTLMNIVLTSSRIQSITFPDKRVFRGNLHAMIFGSIGVGKSTDLYAMARHENKTPTYSITKAHLFGSVDKNTGLPILPMTWFNRRSIIAIDDFYYDRSKHDTMASLLSMMEFPNIEKNIGYRCNDIDERDDGLFIRIKNNKISLNTCFSVIMTTMFNPLKLQNNFMKALASRCVLIPFYPSKEMIYKQLKGEQTYKPKYVRNVKQNMKISNTNYNRIVQFCKDKDVDTSLIKRVSGDLSRILCITNKWDEPFFEFVLNLNNAFRVDDDDVK